MDNDDYYDDEYYSDEYCEDEFESRVYINSKKSLNQFNSLKEIDEKTNEQKIEKEEKKNIPIVIAPWANIRNQVVSFKEQILKDQAPPLVPPPPAVVSKEMDMTRGIKEQNKKRLCKMILEGKKCHNKCLFAHNINELNPDKCFNPKCGNIYCYYIHKNETIKEYCERLNLKIQSTCGSGNGGNGNGGSGNGGSGSGNGGSGSGNGNGSGNGGSGSGNGNGSGRSVGGNGGSGNGKVKRLITGANKKPILTEYVITETDQYIEKISDFSDVEITKIISTKNIDRNDSYSMLSDKTYVLNHLKKTRFCQNMIDKGRCRRENCNFAHKISEFSFPLCVFKDKCVKKDCTFLHPTESVEKYKNRINFTVPTNIC
jgi:hypothetical protein